MALSAVWAEFFGPRLEKSAHTLDKTLHITNNAVAIISQATPGETNDSPSVDDEVNVTCAVGFEEVSDSVDLEAVEFHREFEIGPVGIDLAEAPAYPEVLVRPRCGEPGISDEPDEALLQDRACWWRLILDHPPKLADPAAAVAAVENLSQFGSRNEPLNLGLVAKASHVACTEGGTEVHEGSSWGRHSKAREFNDIVVQRPRAMNDDALDAPPRPRSRDLDHALAIDETPEHASGTVTNRGGGTCCE